MNLADIAAKLRRGTKENSPLLFAVGASAGVVATAYLASKASFKAAHYFEDKDPWESPREKAKQVWRFYIPAAAVGAGTIAMIAGVKHSATTKTLAAQTALTMTQQAFETYREKVIDEFGEKKDEMIRASVAEDRIREKPPTIIAGSGDVLCFEVHTGRYVPSSMQELKRIQNEINAKLIRNDYVPLDDFYYELGLEMTQSSGQLGWTSDKLLELQFASVLHKETPCLAFEYNYLKGL